MSDERRRLAILMNPSAAGGKPLRVLGDVEAELAELGLAHRVIETRDIEHARHAAQGASAAGETVVALGGDGLVGTIASALLDAGPMAVLPGGRGNDFARALGIPHDDVRAACRVIATGHERLLDLGEANGKPFACIASAGFDSEANERANETRVIRGNLVYAYAALLTLARWKPATFKIVADGQPKTFTGFNMIAANTSYYGGGMKVAPSADPSDGLLDVVFVKNAPKRRFLANLHRVFSGRHVNLPHVETFRAREVSIEADRPFTIYADGDPLTDLPATVKVLPRRLRLLVPSGPMP